MKLLKESHKPDTPIYYGSLSRYSCSITKRNIPFLFMPGQMNITPQYLTSIIKAQTGRTVNNFICEMLYSEARNLLALSEFSIQQIATELHFSDQASFSKFFKRWAGISPLEFRNVMVKSKK